MKHDITKLCANSLRTHLNDKHNIKLKSGHAHEIVAAFFGYKSAIAMRQDVQYPISNLEKAKFILLNPPITLVNQRLKTLEALPQDLPSSHILAEGVYPPIMAQKWVLEKVHSSFRDLAILLAEERLRDHTKHLGMNPAPQWITEVDMKTSEEGVAMTVIHDYPTDSGQPYRYSKIEVKLPRMAGNIGYGTPEIMPTFYSGQMRDMAFRQEHGIA